MYHTEPPTDKTIREWYMNSSRVAACALRNEQAVRAHESADSRFRTLSYSVITMLRVTTFPHITSIFSFKQSLS